MLNGWMI